MSEIPATYSCANGEWGPWHAMVKGPGDVKVLRHGRWWETIERRDINKDKTLCGIQLTDQWERSSNEVGNIECKRCRAILRKEGKLDKHSKLLPKDVREDLPALYSQEDVEDPIVRVKFFDPSGSWTWYAIEGEEQEDGDWLFFGLVKGFEEELGYFVLSELESVKGQFGLGIERDKHFKPKPLSEVWDRWPFEKEE